MKFKTGDIVRHLGTRNIYHVLGDPSMDYMLEATNEPAYVYSMGRHNYTKWIMAKSDFEDGSFEKINL